MNSASNSVSPIRPGDRNWLSDVLWTLLFIVGAIVIIGWLMLPSLATPPEAHHRSQCKSHLRNIALALHNYAEQWGGLPPAYTVDENGRKLHSWRTLLLPYLDQQALYDQIDLTKPWNDPANAPARNTVIALYNCPSDQGPHHRISYLALVGDNLAFHPTRSRSFREFADGMSNTLVVIEVPRKQTFDWMAPDDANEQTFLAIHPDSDLSHKTGLHGLMCDGAVRFISPELPEETRWGLMTIDGGEVVEF